MRGVDALFHRINLALQLRLDIVNVAQAYDKTRCGRREMIERNRNADDQLSEGNFELSGDQQFAIIAKNRPFKLRTH